MDINNNTNAEAINAAFTSLSLSPESDTEHTRIGVLYDISVHKSDLACIDAPASSGRARWANDVIVHLGDNISISTTSSNKKHLLLIITPSELLSFTQHMFPNIDVVPILNLHKFGKSMGIPGMGLKKDEFKEAEFRFRLMFKVNDAMGHGLEGLHWNQAFYDIQKVKGIFAVNIAYYWMDTSSNNLNHPVVISIGMKMHKLFETVWPDAIFDGDPLSNTHQIEVPNQSNGEDCGFQSIELFRVLLPCKLQPFGDTTEFVKSTSRVTSDTINTARLNLKDNIIQKLLQAKHQVSDAMELIDDMDGALASLLEPDPSSTVDEDGKVGSADDVAQQAVAAVPPTTHNTTALSTTTNDMDIDVNGLHDDVDKVVTHQELSCMSLGKLKELCKQKGLSTKGKMTKLIDRYLVAQANGFSTKREPTQEEKRADDARRQAKSRANQSDEKRKQVKDANSKQHARVRNSEGDMIKYKQPTHDTKVWEILGKDFTLARHTEDVATAQMLFHLNSRNWFEKESTILVAYVHVVNRLLDRMNDPPSTDEKENRADYVARVEKGLYRLNDLYSMSVKEKITFLRLIGEMLEDVNYWQDYQDWERKTPLMNRDESLMEWLVLSDEGLKIVQEFKFDKRLEERSLEPLIFNRGYDVSITEPDKSICEAGSSVYDKSKLRKAFHRHLEIHGFDVSWMVSIIGLLLSVPEWWWEDGSGNRYSKRSKLWRGEIVDVSLPDYVLGLYQFHGDGYFMFKCEGDDNEYRMTYSDVCKFADKKQSESFLLPKKMPTKYVDEKLHFFCDITQHGLFKLYHAHALCRDLCNKDDVQQVFDALEKCVSPKEVLKLVNDKRRLQRTSYEDRIPIDEAQMRNKFAMRRSKWLVDRAQKRVCDFIDEQKTTPAEGAHMISRFCAKQGRPVAWGVGTGRHLREGRFKNQVNSMVAEFNSV